MSDADELVYQSQHLSLSITSLVQQAANKQKSASEVAAAQLVKLSGERGKEKKLAKQIAGEQEEDAATAEISKLKGNQVVLLSREEVGG